MRNDDFMVLLPAYNEAENISNVILNLEKYFLPTQLLIADDGSTDTTDQITRNLGIYTIKNSHNQGKGYTLLRAFYAIIKKYPNIKWIITFDADGQHYHRDIPNFMKMARNAPEEDIIIGRRDYKYMPAFNLVSNTLTSGWCNYWLKWNLYDLQCGFRCYKTESLQKIIDFGLTRKKFDFETEILLVAWYLGMKMKEIPIKTLYPSNHRKSRIIPSIDTFRWIILILKYGFSFKFLRKIWKKRYIRNQ
ncbi:MAG: glycosyltransferase family 2 protein [Candidatus Hodarchaeales archaeon]